MINEERSYTEYAVVVPTTDFMVGYDFIDNGVDITEVTLNGVDPTTIGYTVLQVNNTTYRFAPAVPSGVVRLIRITDIDQMAHVFTEGAIFVSENMDGNFKQIRHAQQEVRDNFAVLQRNFSGLEDTVLPLVDGLEVALQAAESAATAAGEAADIAVAVQTDIAQKFPNGKLKAVDVLNASTETQQQINDFGGAKWYAKVGGYELGATVKLENGDTVKSTVAANTVSPNVDMSGWVGISDAPQLNYSLQKNKITQTIYDKLYQIWNPKDFGAIGDGTLHVVQEWIDSGKFSGLAAVQVVYPHVTSVTDSIDWAAIQQLINGLPYSPVSTGNPKDGCNGGQSFVSRGQYFINRKFKIKRGLALKGESAESTQFWCLTTDGLFEYDDVGRYLSDELQLQDISLWQDPSVIPTSGAGIKIRSSGLVPEASVSPILRNLIIEGFYNNLDIGDCINLTMSNVNQSKAIDVGGVIDNVTFSTSSCLQSCYGHSNGKSGWKLKGLYYVNLLGMAADSNGEYGYDLENCRGVVIHGGAEANALKALRLKNSYGTNIQVSAVNNLEGAADIDGSFYTSWSCGMLTDNRAGSTKVAITGLNGSNFLEITKGVDLEGSYTTNRITGINNYDDRALPTAIASNGKNWQLGVNQALQTLSQFFFGGLASETTQNGLDLQTNFSKSVGSINKTLNIVFRAVSPDTFANAVGAYIGNGIISGGGSIARKIGQVINKQTGGTSANAHLHLTDADAALPVGSWSLMNNSADPSYFQKMKIGATPSTAPTWTSGSGVPVSSDPVGSMYTRIDGAPGATLYVKEPSGWVAK